VPKQQFSGAFRRLDTNKGSLTCKERRYSASLLLIKRSATTSYSIRARNRAPIVLLRTIHKTLTSHFVLHHQQALHKCGGGHIEHRCIQLIINSVRSVKLESCGLWSRSSNQHGVQAISAPYKRPTRNIEIVNGCKSQWKSDFYPRGGDAICTTQPFSNKYNLLITILVKDKSTAIV